MILPQTRNVDPFSYINTGDHVNKQLCGAVNKTSGIVSGLDLTLVNSQVIHVSKGTCVIDTVCIDVEETDIDISLTDYDSSQENVVYMYFKYELRMPKNQLVLNIKPLSDLEDTLPNSQYIILGFCSGSAGQVTKVTNISSDENFSRSKNYLTDFIYSAIIKQWITYGRFDLDMHHFKILNLADPTNDLDAVNKRYTLQQYNDELNYYLVKVDHDSLNFNHIDGYPYEQGGYLSDVLISGMNITITKEDNNQKIEVSKGNRHCKITSGDSCYRS